MEYTQSTVKIQLIVRSCGIRWTWILDRVQHSGLQELQVVCQCSITGQWLQLSYLRRNTCFNMRQVYLLRDKPLWFRSCVFLYTRYVGNTPRVLFQYFSQQWHVIHKQQWHVIHKFLQPWVLGVLTSVVLPNSSPVQPLEASMVVSLAQSHCKV